jgi:hypothetical protein
MLPYYTQPGQSQDQYAVPYDDPQEMHGVAESVYNAPVPEPGHLSHLDLQEMSAYNSNQLGQQEMAHYSDQFNTEAEDLRRNMIQALPVNSITQGTPGNQLAFNESTFHHQQDIDQSASNIYNNLPHHDAVRAYAPQYIMANDSRVYPVRSLEPAGKFGLGDCLRLNQTPDIRDEDQVAQNAVAQNAVAQNAAAQNAAAQNAVQHEVVHSAVTQRAVAQNLAFHNAVAQNEAVHNTVTQNKAVHSAVVQTAASSNINSPIQTWDEATFRRLATSLCVADYTHNLKMVLDSIGMTDARKQKITSLGLHVRLQRAQVSGEDLVAELMAWIRIMKDVADRAANGPRIVHAPFRMPAEMSEMEKRGEYPGK